MDKEKGGVDKDVVLMLGRTARRTRTTDGVQLRKELLHRGAVCGWGPRGAEELVLGVGVGGRVGRVGGSGGGGLGAEMSAGGGRGGGRGGDVGGTWGTCVLCVRTSERMCFSSGNRTRSERDGGQR